MEQENVEKRGRGRPPGVRPAKLGRYKPKTWTPIHEAIVLASLAPGVTQKMLGEQFGYTQVHICNILSTVEAQEIREKIRGNLNSQATPIEERMVKLREAALKRAEDFISNDQYAQAMPAVHTGVALRVLKDFDKTGNPTGDKSSNNTSITINQQTNNILADQGFLDDVRKGLALSAQVNARALDVSNRILTDGRG